MKFWWVNQNQTYHQEIDGGYLWSPKRKKDGSTNIFYDNMTRVEPGDIVFSFFDTEIPYLGIVTSRGYSQPKPEFGAVGQVWGSDGWMVNIEYKQLKHIIKPKDHMNSLKPLLPAKYSPLQVNGNGNQGVYLTRVPDPLAKKLIDLVGPEAQEVLAEAHPHEGESLGDKDAAEDRIVRLISKNKDISTTEKDALIKSRIGQGTFRESVLALHGQCPFTGISNPRFLRAGHLKPWARCTNNKERLDPFNGIPLTPVADQLVNDGYISFDDFGTAIFSSMLNPSEAAAMGIDIKKAYRFQIQEGHLPYIAYHRSVIFKK